MCDRSRDPYSAAERSRLVQEGISHYHRMLAAYGVPESRWDEYVARNQGGAVLGSARLVRDIAIGEVNCPVHGAAVRGKRCPGKKEACPARVRKAAASAVQRQRRAERRQGGARRGVDAGRLSWSDAVAAVDCPMHTQLVRGMNCGPLCHVRWNFYVTGLLKSGCDVWTEEWRAIVAYRHWCYLLMFPATREAARTARPPDFPPELFRFRGTGTLYLRGFASTA
jgi:hypothetical protein